jgi:hypothetical protein
VNVHVNVHVNEMFNGVRESAPRFLFRCCYRGSTKFTVTGTHTMTGTPSLVAGR